MDKFFQTGILLLVIFAFAGTAYSQKKIKKGAVKFEMEKDSLNDSSGLDMMGDVTLHFYFNDNAQKMDMGMMNGLMRIQTIISLVEPDKSTMLMDMMGQKIQLTDLTGDDLKKSNALMSLYDVKEVVYDKKRKKEIAGYSCYYAEVTTNDGTVLEYYVTDKIQMPPLEKNVQQLAGFPLRMTLAAKDGGKMIFVAKEVVSELPENVFEVEDGYTKMTMEEFEKSIGGGFGK